MPDLTLRDVRDRWSEVVGAVTAADTAITIYRSQPGRPREPTLSPALVALSPAAYEVYREALCEPDTEIVPLRPLDSKSRDVDWAPADRAKRVSLDVRRARSRWAMLNHRVQNDGLHVIVINQYPAPGRPVIVFAPLSLAKRYLELTGDTPEARHHPTR